MKYLPPAILIFLIPLLQNCGEKDAALVSISTIEIHKDVLFEDSLELHIEILDTINLEVPGNPPLTAVHDLAFSQDFFLLVDRRQGLLNLTTMVIFCIISGIAVKWKDPIKTSGRFSFLNFFT